LISKFRRLLILPIIFIFYSCSDSPSLVGIDLLNPDDMVNLKQTNCDSLPQTSSSMIGDIQTGSSSLVMLGNSNSVENSFLMRFNFNYLADTLLTDLLDGDIVINSATISMVSVYTIGDDGAQLDYTAHEITSDWGWTTFTKDSLGTFTYNSENIASNKTVEEDSLYSFTINNSVALKWLVSEADSSYNNGLYIKPTSGSKKVVGFNCYSSSYPIVTIKIAYEKTGVYKDTLTYEVENHLYITSKQNSIPTDDNIYVQGGVPVRSKIKIDLPNLSTSSKINKADLEFLIDTLSSKYGSPTYAKLKAYFLTSGTAIEYDSTTYIQLSKSDNKFTGNIAAYVQRWVNGEANYGLLISDLYEEEDVDYWVLKGSSTANLNERPKLKIIYSIKP